MSPRALAAGAGTRTVLRRAAAVLLVVATVWWLGRMIVRNGSELRAYEWRADPLLLAASVGAHVAVLAWGVWVWSRVLRHFEHPPVTVPTLQRIWFLSNLARYVPGKVFQFVAVAQLSRTAGLSGAVLLTSMLVHTGFALLSAAVTGAWTLAADVLPGVAPGIVAGGATAAAVLAVHPAFLNHLLGLIPRLLKKQVIRWNAGWGDGVLLLALSILSWALYGVAYQMLMASLADVPWRLLPQMTGVNALSFLVGYASPLPGGTGLREVSMSALLQPFLPGGVAAVMSIVSRLWTVAAELIGGTLVLLLVRGRPVKADEGAVGGAPAAEQ